MSPLEKVYLLSALSPNRAIEPHKGGHAYAAYGSATLFLL